MAVRIKGHTIPELSRTFNDRTVESSSGLVALVGSQGYLEVAVRNGNAAVSLSAAIGEPVQVELHP